MMYDDDEIWFNVEKQKIEYHIGQINNNNNNNNTIKTSTTKDGLSTIEIKPELGAKYDSGKLLWGCFTRGLAPVIKGVVAVLTYGAQKYAADSWQQVPNALSRYSDAFDRHWNAYNSGEQFDPESGLHHMLHVVCNAMFIAWFVIKQDTTRTDDDFTKFNKVEKK